MELFGKIKAKIHKHTFDGVPKDTPATIFIPGKKPIKATLSDVEIKEPEKPTTTSCATGAWWASSPFSSKYTFSVDFCTSAPGVDESGVKGADVVASLVNAIPGLKGIHTTCPDCSWDLPAPVTDVIMHLNDFHRWSRHKVADWLETKDWDLQFATPEGAES